VQIYSVVAGSDRLVASATASSFALGVVCSHVTAVSPRRDGGKAASSSPAGKVRCRFSEPVDVQVRELRYPGSGKVYARDVYLMVRGSRTVVWAQARYAGYLSFETRYCTAG
jgi:hypothetical protein